MATTKRRKTPKNVSGQLTDGAITQLMTGYDFFGDGGLNMGELRAAWTDHREALLEMKDPAGYDGFQTYGAGCRPWAFWRFEMKRKPPASRERSFAVLKAKGLLQQGEAQRFEAASKRIRQARVAARRVHV